MLYFVDETGSNPAPPGMQVSLTDSNGATQTAFTIAGGAVPGISLVALMQYTVIFYAERGPAADGVVPQPPVVSNVGLDEGGAFDETSSFDSGSYNLVVIPGEWTFTPPSSGDVTVTIAGYRSPYLSTAGAQQLLAEVFPLQRAGAVAPNLYALQRGIGARTAALDTLLQEAHGALRLQSSSGAAIDSWVADFLGAQTLPRQSGEVDVSYIARVLQWLALPFGTIYALQVAAASWLATASALNALLGPVAADTIGAADTSGALDGGTLSSAAQATPKVLVFDWQSNPALAAAVGLDVTLNQFCVLFTFPNVTQLGNWIVGQSALGNTTFLASPSYYRLSFCPSPDLDAIVRTVKAAGKTPIYAANHPSE